MPDDRKIYACADLSDALRLWLRARLEAPEVQASALAYECAALVAKHAGTEAQAFALIDHWTQSMKAQIHALGVGREHP